MDHKTFVSRTTAALQRTADGKPNDAAAQLRTLLHDLETHTKQGVNDWHQQQTLALLVDALDAAGNEAECRAAWEELLRFTQDWATYWNEASASARANFDAWSRQHPPGTA